CTIGSLICECQARRTELEQGPEVQNPTPIEERCIQMRVVVIGGTGHIGSYLTPMLVEEGYTVTCVSRGARKPYREHPEWRAVSHCKMDRAAEEAEGAFGKKVAALDAEAVVDLT